MFFARTYLMQALGDDLVWPYIREKLASILGNENKASLTVNVFLQPQQQGISLSLLQEGQALLNKVPSHFIPVFRSNISDGELLAIIRETSELSGFLESLQQFVHKWGWLSVNANLKCTHFGQKCTSKMPPPGKSSVYHRGTPTPWNGGGNPGDAQSGRIRRDTESLFC
ncbi:hypothetical protein D6779_05025, partial [Candidatus Parcubacteria bacterium]